MKLLLGQPIAQKIEQNEILPTLEQLKSDRPHLAIILVGDDTDSEVYVRQKEKTGKKLGIEVSVYRLEKSTPADQVKDVIAFLNQDPKVNGTIIQLPLPENLKSSTQELLDLIKPIKDVDALNVLSSNPFLPSLSSFIELKSAYIANHLFLPPTATAALEIIDYYKIPFKGVVLFGRGILVGASVAKILDQIKVKYKVIHSQTTATDQKRLLKKAQLIITGTNSPKPIIAPNDVKPSATIIDCASDFDHNDISSWSGSVTPVIGGVGPVTVACLFRNVVYAKLWQNRNSKYQMKVKSQKAKVKNTSQK